MKEVVHIFVATNSKNPEDEKAGTGDIDYANSISNELSKIKDTAVSRVPHLPNEKKIYEFIKKHLAKNELPILHIMLNLPHRGNLFSIQGLQKIKQAGIKLCITAIEFKKYSYHVDGIKLKKQTLELLDLADQIIFLDEFDRQDAINVAVNPALKEKLGLSRIISVPPTIPILNSSETNRGNDILCFTMIRKGKGFAHLIKLATLIKSTLSPSMKDKKIHIIGTVEKHKTRKNLTAYDGELYKLLKAIYPDYQKNFHDKSPSELIIALRELQKNKITPFLPIELHIDVSEKELPLLFKRCRYAFLPFYRGFTIRNSSIVNCLANNLILFSHSADITPKEFQPDGLYSDALTLLSKANYEDYADQVFKMIEEREENPQKNPETYFKLNLLQNNVLDIENIIYQHLSCYRNLNNTSMIEIDHKEKQKHNAIVTLQRFYRKYRSYKIFKEFSGIDIDKQSDINFARLIDDLLKGVGLSQEELKQRGNKLLTDQEKLLFLEGINIGLYLKHATKNKLVAEKKSPLKSLYTRTLGEEIIDNQHTFGFTGIEDNICTTIGSIDHDIAGFLANTDNYIIRVELQEYFQKGLKIGSGLTGAWLSGHYHEFLVQAFYRFKFGDTFRNLYHHFNEQDPTSSKRVYEYIRHDGTILTREKRYIDEIYNDSTLILFVYFNYILELRYIGGSYRKNILEALNVECIKAGIDQLYHSHAYEVKKPGLFDLHNPGIKITHVKKIQFLNKDQHKDFKYMKKAIKNGDLSTLELGLKKKIPLTIQESNTRDLFTIAIEKKQTESFHWLLDHGYLPSQIDCSGLLTLAVHYNNDISVIKRLYDLLLPNERDPLVGRFVFQNQDYYGCLIKAASLRKKSIIEFLLMRNLPVNNSYGAQALLNVIIKNSHVNSDNIASVILNRDTVVEEGNELSIAAALIKAGAPINGIGTNKFRPTPLLCALKECDVAMVALLLANGADVNILDKPQRGSLLLYVIKKTVSKINRRLNNSSNDSSDDTVDEDTFISKKLDQLYKLVELLLNHGADANAELGNNSALMLALATGKPKIVELLLKFGAKVDQKSENMTPLMLAVKSDDEDIVELLLQYKADVNVFINKEKYDEIIKYTPLIFAVKNGNIKIIKQLLNHQDLDLASQGHIAYRLAQDKAESAWSSEKEKSIYLEIAQIIKESAIQRNIYLDFNSDNELETEKVIETQGELNNIKEKIIDKDVSCVFKFVITCQDRNNQQHILLVKDLHDIQAQKVALPSCRIDAIFFQGESINKLFLDSLGSLGISVNQIKKNLNYEIIFKLDTDEYQDHAIYKEITKNDHEKQVITHCYLINLGKLIKLPTVLSFNATRLKWFPLINKYLFTSQSEKLIFNTLQEKCGFESENIRNSILSLQLSEIVASQCLPLYFTIMKGEEEYIKEVMRLIKLGANIELLNDYNQTVLMEACEQNNINLILFLLQHGANPNKVTTKNRRDVILGIFSAEIISPLLIACKNGHLELVKLLVEYGGDVNFKMKAFPIPDLMEYSELYTPLISAISHDHFDVADFLLSKGAVLKDEDDNNIAWDVINQCKNVDNEKETHINKLRYLQSKNIDLDRSQIFTGESVLIAAVRKSDLESVIYLLKNGVDPDKKTIDHDTAYDFALKHNKNTIAAAIKFFSTIRFNKLPFFAKSKQISDTQHDPKSVDQSSLDGKSLK